MPRKNIAFTLFYTNEEITKISDKRLESFSSALERVESTTQSISRVAAAGHVPVVEDRKADWLKSSFLALTRNISAATADKWRKDKEEKKVYFWFLELAKRQGS